MGATTVHDIIAEEHGFNPPLPSLAAEWDALRDVLPDTRLSTDAADALRWLLDTDPPTIRRFVAFLRDVAARPPADPTPTWAEIRATQLRATTPDANGDTLVDGRRILTLRHLDDGAVTGQAINDVSGRRTFFRFGRTDRVLVLCPRPMTALEQQGRAVAAVADAIHATEHGPGAVA